MRKTLIGLSLLMCTYAFAAPEDDLLLLVDTGQLTEFKVSYLQDISVPEPNYNIDCDDDGLFEGMAETGVFICDYSLLGSGVY